MKISKLTLNYENCLDKISKMIVLLTLMIKINSTLCKLISWMVFKELSIWSITFKIKVLN